MRKIHENGPKERKAQGKGGHS